MVQTKRREFIKTAMAASAAAAFFCEWAVADDPAWEKTWNAALTTLAANIKPVANFDQLVLFEGTTAYRGTWQECGPHESLAYLQLAEYVKPIEGKPSPLEVAKNTHRAFFSQQREDGQIPANLRARGAEWGMIQMVVPIAATAWDVSQELKEEAFLNEAYGACSRWDAWLRRYRDTRGTGLVEAFCTWDTGQDDSPRWRGVSNSCPDGDAKKCPVGQSVPRLCPDLSATVFGARVALSAMAAALGKKAEAQKWKDDAEKIRALILAKLWCEEDASFYDVDPDGNFVRIRTVANLRVLGEHVMRLNVPLERKMFNTLWERQLHNPKAFWTPYPFPSIAMDDPKFVPGIQHASWNGGSQALTALRTLRWMDYYGKKRDQLELAQRWCDAILRVEDFREQMEPDTGMFTGFAHAGYSPCALVFLHFAERLGHAPSLGA
jgi:hypothetical protein